MSAPSLQDILPLVQMPSRYLGTEVNRITKPWEKTLLHVALAFPDLYEIATSHFGIQILYTILNEQEDVLAERVYAPAVDMEALLRNKNRPLCSLESGMPLNGFDIVGFSLLYELNYTNMVNMLDLGGVPLLAEDRQNSDPFIIAGGPCTCNPEPVADFFDAIVIGDGEGVILELTAAWKKWRLSSKAKRKDLLKRWSGIKGVYIPSFFNPSTKRRVENDAAIQNPSHPKVKRAVLADLNESPIPTKPIIPYGRPIHDRLRMEIARGCTRGCRFCQAGMIYRPVRERRPATVLKSIHEALPATGYEDVSLLSLSTGDYSCIAPLLKNIMEYGAKDRLAVSLPSLRAGSLTPELMESIRKVRKTGFTIAPEAGSQRLRDVINKNITEADIFDTVEDAFSLGWKLIKLYFMIGLPTETHDDLQAIVNLVKRLRTIKQPSGRRPRINVSVATFVPKPHTPFQWEPQISLEDALKKLNWLKDNLRLPGIQVKWQDPRVSVIEGVWSRGDRKLRAVLIEAWKSGCRFDGWTDFFDYERWKNVFDKAGLRPDTYTAGFPDTDQPLAWDHIDLGVTRAFLVKERQRAFKGKITVDCRNDACSGCGVCDFKQIQPISYFDQTIVSDESPEEDGVDETEPSMKYVVVFKKMHAARFLGHLEMVKIFIRSIRRAAIPIKYSKGFHPMPKVSFGDTLPMGMQSEEEQMVVVLTETVDPEDMASRLQKQLPSGLGINGCFPYDKTIQTGRKTAEHYHVQLSDGFFNQNDLDSFFDADEVHVEKKNKKGNVVVVDLKKAVVRLELLNDRQASMSLSKDNQQTVRPAQVIKELFHLSEAQLLSAIVTKRKGSHV